MKIDKEKLVEMLVEKTGMEKDEVENQLLQLIDRIKDAAERGKALEIKGFGLFYFDESNKLTFDPSEELSTEISFKYAGMKPVEINPERDTSFVPDPVSGEKSTDKPESKPERVSIFAPDEPFRSEKPEKEKKSDKTEKVEKSKKSEKAAKTQVSEKAAQPKKKKPSVKKKKKSSPKSSDSINNIIISIAAVILIAVLIFGYFYYTDSVDTMTQTGAESPAQLQTLDPVPEETPEMAETPEVIPEMEQVDPAEVTEEADDAGQPEVVQTTYGLMGDLMEDANDGYSIVVHSFNDEINARSTAAELNGDGYRVLVSSRSVSADTVWRVSVGQFQTLQSAVEATNELPSPYNTQNFIQRIQIN